MLKDETFEKRADEGPMRILGAWKILSYAESEHDHNHVNPLQRPSKSRVRLFLIRHGESDANVDKSKNVEMSDHAIDLSD